MSEFMTLSLATLVTGITATAFMDIWALARRQLTGQPSLDYALVGRWLSHMRHGRFRHETIANAPAMPGERLLGWSAHYAIGLVFAALLLLIWGAEWVAKPSLLPALAIGTGSVIAPFFLMQPGMGAGIAASQTPAPGLARLRSLIMHAVFGLGLYAGGWVSHWILL